MYLFVVSLLQIYYMFAVVISSSYNQKWKNYKNNFSWEITQTIHLLHFPCFIFGFPGVVPFHFCNHDFDFGFRGKKAWCLCPSILIKRLFLCYGKLTSSCTAYMSPVMVWYQNTSGTESSIIIGVNHFPCYDWRPIGMYMLYNVVYWQMSLNTWWWVPFSSIQ